MAGQAAFPLELSRQINAMAKPVATDYGELALEVDTYPNVTNSRLY